MSTASQSWLPVRIWRAPGSNFNQGDMLASSEVYTMDYLRQVKEHGFNAIWVRGKLQDLACTQALPELDARNRQPVLTSLQTTLQRCQALGLKLFLFFNDPLALGEHDPFWQQHPDLRGAPHRNFSDQHTSYALCTSTPLVKQYLAQASADVIANLPGIGGVILITASEHHTHCWSHHTIYAMDHRMPEANHKPAPCERCANREPADIVAEIVQCWLDATKKHQPDARVLVWNWSWSMWYRDPQREVIDALPEGAELLADMERGGQRPWRDQTIWIDEYSLSYTGPSARFLNSQAVAASRGMPVHAKLQIGTTHEMANVPNLPLVANLHAKFVAMQKHDVRGAMCTWAIGCGLTLNTFAMGLFAEDPRRYHDADAFYDALAKQYLGLVDAGPLKSAWQAFTDTWQLFPFCIPFIYFGPMNIAPGMALEPAYRQSPLKGTWIDWQDYGDMFETRLGPYTLDQVTDALGDMAQSWPAGLEAMAQALAQDRIVDHGPVARQRRFEEWSCAQMVGLQIRSAYHLLAFHRWRLGRIQALNLPLPCEAIPLDETGIALIEQEIDVAQQMLPLVQADSRLGFHHEAQCYQYNEAILTRKISTMRQILDRRS